MKLIKDVRERLDDLHWEYSQQLLYDYDHWSREETKRVKNLMEKVEEFEKLMEKIQEALKLSFEYIDEIKDSVDLDGKLAGLYVLDRLQESIQKLKEIEED